MKLEAVIGKDYAKYFAVKEVRGKDKILGSVMWLPHPVCCGIGIIAGVSRNFLGLDKCLEAAEKKAFVEEAQAIAMFTSNVEEQGSFLEILRARHWQLRIQTPNPIHQGRELTVWVKYNPDPKGAASRFSKGLEVTQG